MGEIELTKIYADHLICIGVAFYKTQDGKILRLSYSEPIERRFESEEEEFGEAWLQITTLQQDKYSPPVVRGKISLDSDQRLLVESNGRIYHFENSSEEEIEKIKEYTKN